MRSNSHTAGHQLVNEDCRRLSPTKAVKSAQAGCTQTVRASDMRTMVPARRRNARSMVMTVSLRRAGRQLNPNKRRAYIIGGTRRTEGSTPRKDCRESFRVKGRKAGPKLREGGMNPSCGTSARPIRIRGNRKRCDRDRVKWDSKTMGVEAVRGRCTGPVARFPCRRHSFLAEDTVSLQTTQ